MSEMPPSIGQGNVRAAAAAFQAAAAAQQAPATRRPGEARAATHLTNQASAQVQAIVQTAANKITAQTAAPAAAPLSKRMSRRVLPAEVNGGGPRRTDLQYAALPPEDRPEKQYVTLPAEETPYDIVPDLPPKGGAYLIPLEDDDIDSAPAGIVESPVMDDVDIPENFGEVPDPTQSTHQSPLPPPPPMTAAQQAAIRGDIVSPMPPFDANLRGGLEAQPPKGMVSNAAGANKLAHIIPDTFAPPHAAAASPQPMAPQPPRVSNGKAPTVQLSLRDADLLLKSFPASKSVGIEYLDATGQPAVLFRRYSPKQNNPAQNNPAQNNPAQIINYDNKNPMSKATRASLEEYIITLKSLKQINHILDYNQTPLAIDKNGTNISAYEKTDAKFYDKHEIKKDKPKIDRFPNILNLKTTKVNDNVNANFVRFGKLKFIAAQAPATGTTNKPQNSDMDKSGISNEKNFYAMVKKQNVRDMVVILGEEEWGKDGKPYKHWPVTVGEVKNGFVCDEILTHGNIPGLITYRLRDNETGKTLEIHNITNWKDFGVVSPEDTIKTIEFLNAKRAKTKDSAPIMVHCNAGAGRTGVFLGIMGAMATGNNDPKSVLTTLRQQRMGAIQTAQQYLMLDDALNNLQAARRPPAKPPMRPNAATKPFPAARPVPAGQSTPASQPMGAIRNILTSAPTPVARPGAALPPQTRTAAPLTNTAAAQPSSPFRIRPIQAPVVAEPVSGNITSGSMAEELLKGKEYFLPTATADDVKALLSDQPQGTFLIRKTTDRKDFAINFVYSAGPPIDIRAARITADEFLNKYADKLDNPQWDVTFNHEDFSIMPFKMPG